MFLKSKMERGERIVAELHIALASTASIMDEEKERSQTTASDYKALHSNRAQCHLREQHTPTCLKQSVQLQCQESAAQAAAMPMRSVARMQGDPHQLLLAIVDCLRASGAALHVPKVHAQDTQPLDLMVTASGCCCC